MDIRSDEMVFSESERRKIVTFPDKCPHLRVAPFIPHADKWYCYCDMEFGPSTKLPIGKEYALAYCSNSTTKASYRACEIWQRANTT